MLFFIFTGICYFIYLLKSTAIFASMVFQLLMTKCRFSQLEPFVQYLAQFVNLSHTTSINSYQHIISTGILMYSDVLSSRAWSVTLACRY